MLYRNNKNNALVTKRLPALNSSLIYVLRSVLFCGICFEKCSFIKPIMQMALYSPCQINLKFTFRKNNSISSLKILNNFDI